jgi:hypothetical protein
VTATWTPEAVRALGVKTDVTTAGSIFGLSRTQAYEALKHGNFPVSVIKVGRRLVVPVQPILGLLGLDTATAGASPAPAASPADPSPKEVNGHASPPPLR